MPQRQPQSAPQKTPQPQVGFEVREIMSLLAALESLGGGADKTNVH
jgi:hypothetical protein